MSGWLLKNNKQHYADKGTNEKMLSQHSELRKGYFNKDYLVDIYKH
jgi:hypothetical protein